MKSKKSSSRRRPKIRKFDDSIVNLAQLAGLPISRPRSRSYKGEHIDTGISINMAGFETGLSDLLQSTSQS